MLTKFKKNDKSRWQFTTCELWSWSPLVSWWAEFLPHVKICLENQIQIIQLFAGEHRTRFSWSWVCGVCLNHTVNHHGHLLNRPACWVWVRALASWASRSPSHFSITVDWTWFWICFIESFGKFLSASELVLHFKDWGQICQNLYQVSFSCQL